MWKATLYLPSTHCILWEEAITIKVFHVVAVVGGLRSSFSLLFGEGKKEPASPAQLSSTAQALPLGKRAGKPESSLLTRLDRPVGSFSGLDRLVGSLFFLFFNLKKL